MRVYGSFSAAESMWIFDGGEGASLPDEESEATVISGSQAVFVGSRIDADGPTLVTLADAVPGEDSGLLLEYRGVVETPEGRVRLLNSTEVEYWSMTVEASSILLDVWVDYVPEPGVIWFVVRPNPAEGGHSVARSHLKSRD